MVEQLHICTELSVYWVDAFTTSYHSKSCGWYCMVRQKQGLNSQLTINHWFAKIFISWEKANRSNLPNHHQRLPSFTEKQAVSFMSKKKHKQGCLTLRSCYKQFSVGTSYMYVLAVLANISTVDKYVSKCTLVVSVSTAATGRQPYCLVECTTFISLHR